MKHYIAIVLSLLSGCATTGDTPPAAATNIAVEGRSYDDVWNASIAVVRNEGLTIVESNKDNGVVKAEHRYESSSEKEVVGIFISPPMNSTIYTIEVKTLKGSKFLPISHNWDDIAVGLKKALSSKPQTYGTIGLVSARFVPVIELNEVTDGKAQGSLKGAKKGATIGATPGVAVSEGTRVVCSLGPGYTYGGSVVCAVLWVGGMGVAIAGGAVGAVAGGVIGAVKADSAETVQEQQERAKAVLAELKIQEIVRDRFEQYAKERGRPMFVTISDTGPTSLYEEVSYQSLSPQKIDTVLEITVTRLGMQTGDKYKLDIDLSLAVFINARSRLVQTKNNTLLQDRPYIFESETRTLSEWSADNGRLTAESLTQGYQKIAEQIFHSAF